MHPNQRLICANLIFKVMLISLTLFTCHASSVLCPESTSLWYNDRIRIRPYENSDGRTTVPLFSSSPYHMAFAVTLLELQLSDRSSAKSLSWNFPIKPQSIKQTINLEAEISQENSGVIWIRIRWLDTRKTISPIAAVKKLWICRLSILTLGVALTNRSVLTNLVRSGGLVIIFSTISVGWLSLVLYSCQWHSLTGQPNKQCL